MKKNCTKRIASLVMVFAMLLSYIPGTVWAVDSSTDIKAIEKPTGLVVVEDYDDYFGDDWEDKLGLPETVTVTLANNTTAEALVTWDTSVLDTRTTGYYSIPGDVTLPAGATNGQNLKATITVQVAEKKNLLTNGNFDKGATGWKGWTLSGVKDPLNDSNNVLLAKKSAMVTSAGGNQAIFQGNVDAINALVKAFQQAGVGQYYIAIDAMSAPYSASTPALTTVEAWIHMIASTTGSSSGYVNAAISDKVQLSTTKWTTISKIVELDSAFNWMRTDVKAKAATTDPGAIYLDNFQLVPLKLQLLVEPANVAAIKTEILSRSVVLNYPEYVGDDWKTQLGLPDSVEVLTDAGTTATVDVTWSYAGLDFTKYGKYTLVGKLDDSSFPNPEGLTVQQDIYVTKLRNLLTNGDFEKDATSWKGWTLQSMADPTNAANRVLFAKKSEVKITPGGEQIIYQGNAATISALVSAFAKEGSGQYYFYIDAMSAPYDAGSSARTDLDLWIELRYNTNSASTSSSSAGTSNRLRLSATEWKSIGMTVELQDSWNWLRTDVKCKGEALAPGAVYLDNFQLFPLNVTIPKGQEPAEVAEIITEIPVRAVVKDYNKYVGTNWQAALGLPAQVEVLTAKGNTALVDVTWDYAPLNLGKTGKYTLVGTLDNSTYPNPQELYVTQVIYIREYKNLIPNPSFESGTDGWYLKGLNPSRVSSPVKDGRFAGATGTWTPRGTLDESLADTRNMTENVGAAVALQGGGQYYYSMWAQASCKTLPENLRMQTRFLYKTKDEATGELSAAITTKSDIVAASNKAFVQSSNIVEMPENVGWVRIDLYYIAKAAEDFNGMGTYVDYAELVPLNIIIERHEGAMEQVETIIPQRKIIQNYQDYLGGTYTLADLMLPETVDVRSTLGEIVTIGVNWDISKLDLTKTGQYKVYGSLEDMRLDNPNGLTIENTIHVVTYKNLLENPSFEDYGDNWKVANHVSAESGIMSPVKDGSLSLLMKVGRLENLSTNWIQSLWLEDTAPFGQRITMSGGGRYYFGGWAHGTNKSTDMQIYTRFWYRNYDNGDTVVNKTSPTVNLTTSGFVSSGTITDLPDDIYWARLDMYVAGTISAMKNSELYIDHMELIPLNVEMPYANDIINCEIVADVYAHEGTAFEDLGLPKQLEITLKNGQYFKVNVNWDMSALDVNKIGAQTITGTLDLGTRYMNTKNFIPTTVVIIRAKGEELRQTIYIANDGSENNDGLSPEKPKKEITKIPEYLAQGYNVRLKKGDIWYIPTGSLTFKYLYGTEKAPLTITSYGEGARPIIGFMMKIENNAWKLVDAKRNVYAADVTAFGQKNGESVHRCFVDNEAFFHKSRTNYATLDEEEFCSYNNTIYVRMPAGKAPKNVEVTPFGSGADRIKIQHVSYLTFEDIHIKGASSIFPVIRMDAPTKFVKFTKCDITHGWYYHFLLEADDERVHYKPEFSYLHMDTMVNVKEGAESGYYEQYWNPHGIEGITMRDGVDGAWIHHNYMRGMAHAYVAIESLDKAAEYKTTGCYNCVIEDNVFESGNILYSRPFNICGGRNLSGNQMCHDNIYRRNKAYDMTVSSHLYGENNLIYSNLISYSHTTYNEDGTLFDGKSAQPWGFDTIPWSDHGSVGNVVINNTFYDVAGAVACWDQAETVYNNLYANNLVVNWKSDSKSTHNAVGAFYDNTVGFNYYMHNGVYSHTNAMDHFVVDDKMYLAEDVNNAVSGYVGNISGDPKFLNADLTLLGKGVRQDFTLSGESPMRYAGLSLYDPVFENFPVWSKLKAEYTDINGVVYLAESPSIGAWSFCEKIKGDVAKVGEFEDILARPGATIEQLMLPDSVPAVNDQGIDVVLLVTWNTANFDSSKPGTITLTGELRNGPHTELNINGKTASINVNVKDKLELMNIVTRVDTLTVLYGTSFEAAVAQLPSALHVVEESGFEEDLPVTWTCMDYDGNKPGDYTFKCVLPEDMLMNPKEFDLEVVVRVMHELGRGVELLINSDFIDGSSAAPWALGWLSGNPGTFRVTTDPALLPEGEPAGAIVTVGRRYASIQQDVTGQVQLMGDGKYLFRVKMRAYDPGQPIDTSYACLQQLAPVTVVHRCRPFSNIGTEYVEYYKIMDLQDVMNAQSFTFHTSTGKSREDAEDGPRSYVIAGCSFIYLGKTDAEVNATLDSIDLTWNTIKGENVAEGNVMSDLKLPSKIGAASTIKWTSSDESVITNDGKVTMGRVPKTVTMTATITYKGKETVKKFMVTVPRNPDLPTFSGSLTGSQTAQVGDEIQVTIKLNAEKATSFNAYRFTLSYNVTRLEYVGISDSASVVETDGGRIIISGIGTERPITDTITLTFKVKKSGITEVKLVKVEMDIDPNASLDNLPTMTVIDGAAVIDVQKGESDKKEDDKTTVESENKDDSSVIWIVIGLVAAALVAGGAIAIILIKKKKQNPSETEN